MPENDNNQEALDAIAQMSFLPPKAVDVNAGREFPILTKKESLVRLIFACLMSVAAVVFIILSFVFAGPSSKNFGGEKGYGALGLVTTTLFALTLPLTQFASYLFDTKWSLKKEEKDYNKMKAAQVAAYYFAFLFFFIAAFTTMLRPAILTTYASMQGHEAALPLSIVFFVVVVLLSVFGIVINFVKPGSFAKIFNYVILVGGLWTLLFFANILTRQTSITNAGIFLHIWAPIICIPSLVFFLLQKKHYCKSIAACLFSFTYFIEFALILNYALLNAAYMG